MIKVSSQKRSPTARNIWPRESRERINEGIKEKEK
jgi:hypothetical protein